MLDSTIGSANLHPINRFASTSGRLILLCHAELMKTPWKDARIELDPVDTQITELDAIFQKKKKHPDILRVHQECYSHVVPVHMPEK